MTWPTVRSVLLFCVGLAAFCAPSRAADPAEGVTIGEHRLSLDGTWDFTIDPDLAGDAKAQWDQLVVPGNWDTQPAYRTHKGKGWYRRAFEVPAAWKGQRIRLCFDAVYHEAEVTLNGRKLGTHVGGYTPF